MGRRLIVWFSNNKLDGHVSKSHLQLFDVVVQRYLQERFSSRRPVKHHTCANWVVIIHSDVSIRKRELAN